MTTQPQPQPQPRAHPRHRRCNEKSAIQADGEAVLADGDGALMSHAAQWTMNPSLPFLLPDTTR